MQVSASSFAQKITLSEKNAPLTRIFEQIRKQSGFDFMFNSSTLKGVKNVSIQIKDAELKQVLDELFDGQPLEYEISSKSVIITKKEPSFLDNIIARFTAIDVRGVVVDGESGLALAGASVKVKGSGKATTTGSDGAFYLPGVDEKDVIVVSFIGYKSIEIKAAKELGLIKLEIGSSALEEVNVTYSTGYQNLPKERATGSFTMIDNKTLNQQVGTNILKRLDGVASGFQSINKQDQNRKLGIAIRGLSTINGPLDPLVVLDGFIYEGNIDNINPNDVDNVFLLKDAAAASIWGARAGNGVVVITTKKGKFNQKAQISVNSTFIAGTKPDLFRLPRMSSADYIDVEAFLFKQGYFDSKITSNAYLCISEKVVTLFRGKLATPGSALNIRKCCGSYAKCN